MRWIAALVGIACLAIATDTAAEEIVLTDGTKVIGRMTAIKGDSIEVETSMGRLVIPRDKVVSITFPENIPPPKSDERKEKEAVSVDDLLEGTTYTNWTAGFTLAVPEGWKTAEHLLGASNGVVAALTSADNAIILMVTREAYERSIESYLGLLDAVWKSQVDEFEKLTQSNTSIAGQQAVLIVFRGKTKVAPYVPVRFIVAVIPEEGRVTRVMGWCAEPLFEEAKDALEKMVVSYHPFKQ